ncbi:S8 family serine peptidase [Weeksellaceae bacterium TAE3-ERU29]|nr:S8 family serine peptidase [Weeksellaceae bacterium TAE3-ERU29]
MKEILLLNSRVNLKTVISVVSVFLATSGISQTIEQKAIIQKSTDLGELQKIEQRISSNTPTVLQLKETALDINAKFKGIYQNNTYQFSGFYKGKIPRYLQTYNSGAAATTNTNKLYREAGVFELSGKDMVVGIWDDGAVLADHVEYSGRATQKDKPDGFGFHATHVGGTMIAKGVNPEAKGMAYEAKLNAYDWNRDTPEMIKEAGEGLLLSNHSYGYNGGFVFGDYSGNRGWHWFGSEDEKEFEGFGKYSRIDSNWDAITYKAPYYLPVRAAGNAKGDGPRPGESYYISYYDSKGKLQWKLINEERPKNGGELGFDCIMYGATAKNTLIIGAAHKIPNGYKTPEDVILASFSSTGPTDDGRIKPDIVGVGVGVLSLSDQGNESYAALNGTSMASPNVTGSLLLLQQHYGNLNDGIYMKAATLKALVINTANEAGAYPGPDYQFGYGLLDAYKAAMAIRTKNIYSIFKEQKLEEGATDIIKVKALGNEPLKITLAWQDAPSFKFVQGLNNRTKMIVNDLDIVVKKGDETYYPWKLDPDNPTAPAVKAVNNVDNIEQVEIENPEPGAEYSIIISHKDKLRGNGQEYSIVGTGLLEREVKDLAINEIKIKVSEDKYSEKTPVEVQYTNFGKANIDKATIKYYLINKESGNTENEGELNIENLESNKEESQTFTVDLSQSFVNYTIKVEAIYNEDNILENNIKTINAYGIITNLVPDNARLDYGFEEDLSERGWTKDVQSSWERYSDNRVSYTGENSIVNLSLNTVPNDWLYSNPLKLKGGKTYRVVYFARNIQDFKDKLKIAFGTQPDGRTMETVGKPVSLTTAFTRYDANFTPKTDGVYYIGIHNYTENNGLSFAVILDDFTIMDAEGKAYADFYSKYYKLSTYDENELYDGSLSKLEIKNYNWEITPSTFEYLNNTNQNSAKPIIKFSAEGTYSVKLSVTNEKGTDSRIKQNYIKVENVPVTPNFEVSDTIIYDNNKVLFKDLSVGSPMPKKWKWEVSPQTSIEFTDGTNETSQNPVVLFGREGYYNIKLIAESELGESSALRNNYIEVIGRHFPVNNLAYEIEENKVKLHWDRPKLKPIYSQYFENKGKMPSGITLFDEDGDGKNWEIESSEENVSQGKYSAKSMSWFKEDKERNRDVKNWLVTEKIKSGAEQLKLDVKSYYTERFKIYIIPSDKITGDISVNKIKDNGDVIFDFDGTEKLIDFKTMFFDIKKYQTTDIYIAILHYTKKEDSSLELIIDNLEVGFKNVENVSKESEKSDEKKDEKKTESVKESFENQLLKKENFVVNIEHNQMLSSVRAYNESKESPKLVGYEIVKNNKELDKIDGMDTTEYIEIAEKSGTFIYDVYALYSDKGKSIKERVTAEVVIIPIKVDEEIKTENNNKIQIYPNPSDGLINIKLDSKVEKYTVSVYDLTGRLIFTREYSSNPSQIDIRNLTSGVYILNVIDDKNKQESFKIIKN